MTLRALDTEPELPEKVSSTVLLTMVAGMAVWLPATFVPMAAWVFDMKSISIRRKLPVAQWSKRLYW
jgi:hypothetical protein